MDVFFNQNFYTRTATNTYACSPLSTDSGEFYAAVWTIYDKTIRLFQFTGSTWVSNTIATDANGLGNVNCDVALTTNGVDLNCFYTKLNSNNNFVTCSRLGTKTGGSWSWGTETTIATDTSTNYLSNTRNLDTVTYSGKNGYFPVFWTEGNNTVQLKVGTMQTPLLVRAVSPTSATNTSASTLSVSGLGFFNTSAVNKVAALKLSNGVGFTSWNVSDDLTINNAVLPAGTAPGTYNVIVTDSAGLSATSSVVFTVTGSAYSTPAVTGITPASGYNVYPSTVTITGTNFMGGVGSAGFTSSVALSASGNAYQLTGWTVANESTINGAVLAAGIPVGAYSVLVTTGAGVSPSGSAVFTVIAGPDVTSITLASGSEGSAATLTLTGSGFFAGTGTGQVTAINLNDGTFTSALTGFSVVSDSLITGAVVPSYAFPSTYNVRITTTGTTNLTSTAKYVINRYSFSGSNAKQVYLPNNVPGSNGYRRLILNSDGKIAAFFPGGDATGGPLCFALSADGGATFGSTVTVGGSLSNLSNQIAYTVYKDPSSDDIYAAFYTSNFIPGGRRSVWIEKLTYSGGTYSTNVPINVVPYTSTSTLTLTGIADQPPNISVLKEPSTSPNPGRLWVAYTFYSSANNYNKMCLTYSDNNGTNWHGNVTGDVVNQPDHYEVDMNSQTVLLNYPSLFYWNGRPAVSFNLSSSTMQQIAVFDGSYWPRTSSNINGNSGSDYSVTATDDGKINGAYATGGVVYYSNYVAGGQWSNPVVQISPTGMTICKSPSLATDGVNLWLFYVNGSGPANLVYKKRNAAGIWDANETVVYSSFSNLTGACVMERPPSNASYLPVIVYENASSPFNLIFRKVALPPTVSTLSVTTAANSVPVTLSVSGSGFFGGQSVSDVYSVKLSDTNNTSLAYGSVTDTTIGSVVVPAGINNGTYNVIVTTGAGSNTTSAQTYAIPTTAVPVVSAFSPSTGATNSYTTINITGTGFYGGVGSANVLNIVLSTTPTNTTLFGYSVQSDTYISGAVVPPGAALGSYNIQVTNGGGANSSSATLFTVTSGAPTVSYSVPASGQSAYPTTVSIIGTGFFGGTGSSNVTLVQLGATAITTYSVISDTLIAGGVIPAGLTLGSYNILVTTKAGSNATSASQFGVLAPVPVVSSLSVASGLNSGSTTTTITGLGFFGGAGSNTVTAVTLMSTPSTALSYTAVPSDTSITGVIIPSGIAAGSYVVRVTAAGGSNSTGALFTVYSASPTVASIYPASRDNTGPCTATIYGSGFFAGGSASAVTNVRLIKTSVTAATITLSGFSVLSDTQIVNAVIPLGFPHDGVGTYDVKVATPVAESTAAVKFTLTSTQPLTNYNVGASKPFTTIQSAMNQLAYDTNGVAFSAAQNINIYTGTYTEDVTNSATLINPITACPLTIQGYPGENVIIDGQNTRTEGITIKVNAGNFIIKNLRIQNTLANCISLGTPATNITITNVTCLNWNGNQALNGSYGAGAIYSYSGVQSNIYVANCVFDNSAKSIGVGGDNGTYFRSSSGASTGLTILSNQYNNCQAYFNVPPDNCMFDSNYMYNFALNGENPVFVSTSGVSNVHIRNNSIMGPFTVGPLYGIQITGCGTGAAPNNVKIYNNLIANMVNVQGIYNTTSYGTNIYNNTFYNCGSSAPLPAITATTASKTTILNNIIYITTPSATAFSLDSTSCTNSWVDYNCVYGAPGITNNYGTWGGALCANYTVWSTATSSSTSTTAWQNGTDTHSITLNPMFVNTSGTFSTSTDFKLSPLSPVKVKATNGTAATNYITSDFFGTSRISKLWDIGFYQSYDMPVVSAVSPGGAITGTATTITITGTGFLEGTGLAGATSASINGTALTLTGATISDTSISGAIVPTSIGAGTYSVQVTTPLGTGASAANFVITSAPVVYGVTPASGDSTFPVTVALTGAGFTGVTGITLKGVSNGVSVPSPERRHKNLACHSWFGKPSYSWRLSGRSKNFFGKKSGNSRNIISHDIEKLLFFEAFRRTVTDRSAKHVGHHHPGTDRSYLHCSAASLMGKRAGKIGERTFGCAVNGHTIKHKAVTAKPLHIENLPPALLFHALERNNRARHHSVKIDPQYLAEFVRVNLPCVTHFMANARIVDPDINTPKMADRLIIEMDNSLAAADIGGNSDQMLTITRKPLHGFTSTFRRTAVKHHVKPSLKKATGKAKAYAPAAAGYDDCFWHVTADLLVIFSGKQVTIKNKTISTPCCTARATARNTKSS